MTPQARVGVAVPLSFEKNEGQSSSSARFLARGPGFTLAVEPHRVVIGALRKGSGSPELVQMNLMGANRAAAGEAIQASETKSNYLIGSDPKQWRAGVSTFGKVRFRAVYPGIDIVYYGNENQLEYDFELQPGADPARVRLGFQGANAKPFIDKNGDLVLGDGDAPMRFRKPVAYQEIGTQRRSVEVTYRIAEDSTVRLAAADYDRNHALVIDPVLTFTSVVGGSNVEAPFTGRTMVRDAAGNHYITATTNSSNFPTASALQPTLSLGGQDIFVSKLSADGTTLLYSTYLGGSNFEYSSGIQVDIAGNIYVSGITASTDFPTAAAAQATNSGNYDAFLLKLNPSGSALIYSTYLGGSSFDGGYGLALDPATGVAAMAGATQSTNFPTSVGAYQTAHTATYAAFAAKYSATGVLQYSSLLSGPTGDNLGYAVALDSAGSVYVTGYTTSSAFPTTPGAYRTTYSAGADVFVTKFAPTGSSLSYSTFLGGSGQDFPLSIAIDGSQNSFVTGHTISPDFPSTPGAADPTAPTGTYKAFVSKISASGASLLASTFYGGSLSTFPSIITLDASGNPIIAGTAYSSDLPMVTPVQSTKIGVPFPLYRSADAGASWGPLSAAAGIVSGEPSVTGMATAPANGNRIMISQGTRACLIFRSDDRGATWSSLGSISLCEAGSIVPHPSNQDTWFAFDATRVFRTTDAGATWTSISTGIPTSAGLLALTVSPSNPSVLYAGSNAALYKTTNGGTSWTAVASESSARGLYVSPTDPNTVIAAGNGLRKSTNGGTSFANLSTPICCAGRFAGHPTSASTLFYALAGLMFKSTDGGANWSSAVIGAGSDLPTVISFNGANPQEMYLGYQTNGIYRSADGGATWASVNGTTPLRQDTVLAIAVSPGSGPVVLAGFQLGGDGFVARFSSDLTALQLSSYFGLPGFDGVAAATAAGTDIYLFGSAVGSGVPSVGGGFRSPSLGSDDSYVTRISDGNGGCVTSLFPSTVSADFYGGNSAIRVVTGGGCNWTVSATPAWVTAHPTSGSGLGLVELSYTRNNTGAPRAGNVTINGQNAAVSQLAGPTCSILSISPSRVISSSAWSNPAAITVFGSLGCQFTVVSDSPWATITSGSAISGSGTVAISVTANASSTARTATITVTSVGGVAVATSKIFQSGTGCTNSLTTSSGAVGSSGGPVVVQFATSPSGCSAWQASSDAVWASVAGDSFGSGNASVTFNVAANLWNSPRITTLRVADQAFVLTQAAGSSCSPSGALSPLTQVNSSLSTSDCLSQQRSDGSSLFYSKQFTFTATAGQPIALDLQSSTTTLNPLMLLYAPNGTLIFLQNASGERTIRLPSTGFTTATAAGTYRVEVTSTQAGRTGNFSLRLIPDCAGTLSRTRETVPAAGGVLPIPVALINSCSWTQTNYYPSLVSVTSAATRTGSGVVTVSVPANILTSARLMDLNIAGSNFQINQAGTGPATPFNPSFVRLTAAAANNLTVSSTASSAQVYAVSTKPWLTVNGYNPTTGLVTYSVTANTGPERIAQILLGSSRLTVQQASTSPDKIGIYVNGAWVMDLNGNGTFEGNPTDKYVEFGTSLYGAVLGDWMGQGKTSMGIWYAGFTYIDFNQNRQWDGSALDLYSGLGSAGWTIVTGDWDGDGITNAGVYKDGLWYLDWNGDFRWEAGVDRAYTFGGVGATPVVGDWNLDGKTEVGAYINGLWYLDYNGDGAYVPASDKQVGFGVAGFLPVVGDWNGDGRTKIGIVRNGEWYVDYNGNFQWDDLPNDRSVYFGTTGWTPVLGDWNGDGKKKIGIFNNGEWYLDYNGNYLLDGPDKHYFFGAPGQTPIVGKW